MEDRNNSVYLTDNTEEGFIVIDLHVYEFTDGKPP